MAKSQSVEEQPKRKVAKRVISAKQLYFVPDHGVSVEASSSDEAVKLAQKQRNNTEDGDG